MNSEQTMTIINKLIISARKVYFKTPSALRFIFLPFIGLRDCLHIRVDQWILTQVGISSNHGIKIRYSGNLQNKNYLADLIFGGAHEEKYLGKRHFWNCLGGSAKQSGCSLNITDIPRNLAFLFMDRHNFIIPNWIDGEIELLDDYTPVFKNDWSLRRNQRKIRINQFYYEVTRDPLKIERFYYDMYVPYISKVYGDKALVTSYNNVKEEIDKYELLCVKKQGQDIAGSLMHYTNKEVKWSLSGVKDGNMGYVHDGVIGALYYFTFSYLYKKGYKNVDMGGSRAFLKDGVLNFKKKWGLKISRATEIVFLMKVLSLDGGVKEFLLNNPFIFVDKKGFNGAFFIESDHGSSKEDLENNLKNYQLEGMRQFFVYKLGEDGINLWQKVTLPNSDL